MATGVQPALAATPPPPAVGASPASTQTASFWGAPTAKVGVGALAGSITVMTLAILRAKWPTLVQDSQVGAAITSLLTFVVQYLVPERK